jgi:hypothetical protein
VLSNALSNQFIIKTLHADHMTQTDHKTSTKAALKRNFRRSSSNPTFRPASPRLLDSSFNVYEVQSWEGDSYPRYKSKAKGLRAQGGISALHTPHCRVMPLYFGMEGEMPCLQHNEHSTCSTVRPHLQARCGEFGIGTPSFYVLLSVRRMVGTFKFQSLWCSAE